MSSSPAEPEEIGASVNSLKAIKVRVYPNQAQKILLSQWFGVCRWTYNQCAQALNQKAVSANKKELRAKFVNLSNFDTQNQWVKEVPYDVRDEAMNDTLKALKAYKAKKAVNQNGFTFRYRSKRDEQSLTILKKHWGCKSGSSSRLFSSAVLKTSRTTKPLPEELPHDSRLIKDKLNRYYLCIPMDQVLKPNPRTPAKMVAIDPGVRTFLTCYDQEGHITEIGKGDKTRLFQLGLCADKLQSKIKKLPRQRGRAARKNKMRKALLRIYDRIRNLTDDVHKKSCKWLLENHQTILIPTFNSSSMTKKDGRKIHSKTVRSMLHWSHFRFRQRLMFKNQEYPDSKVIVVTEEYTSVTCGSCGSLNDKLGKKKHFECPSCPFQCNRDVNGARNIMLKYLTEHVPLSARRGFGTLPLPQVVALPLDAENDFYS